MARLRIDPPRLDAGRSSRSELAERTERETGHEGDRERDADPLVARWWDCWAGRQ